MYVLDTDVVSKTSPLATGAAGTIAWIERRALGSYISTASLAELHFGLARLARRGASRRVETLANWVAEIAVFFEGRTLSVDPDIARRTGELLARAEAAGHDPGFVDACIAATADNRGFQVVTFNARHFAAFGVPHRAPHGNDLP